MNRDALPRTMRQVLERLAELLGTSVAELKAKEPPAGLDALIGAKPFTFAIQWRTAGDAGPVALALRALQAAAKGTVLPLVAVPYMGPVGRELCQAAKVGWLDLSGNACIVARNLRVVVDGRPNLFKRPGRPSTAFAPVGARLTRWLLLHPERAWTQRELARETSVDEGFASRVVAKLLADGLLERVEDGALRPPEPALLLDAWREAYDFSKHTVLRGHVPTRSSDDLVHGLAQRFEASKLEHAMTGLSAAWAYSRFAGYRIATFYLGDEPTPELLAALSFHEGRSGENTWLVVPNDPDVFLDAADVGGVRCAHPLQVYLDLKGHPERSKEAAAQLREGLARGRLNV
jgi:hypothetical protein